MTVFSCVEAAYVHGFAWLEYDESLGLHLVARDLVRDGRRMRALAYARAVKVPED